jgi:hypothetical protein
MNRFRPVRTMLVVGAALVTALGVFPTPAGAGLPVVGADGVIVRSGQGGTPKGQGILDPFPSKAQTVVQKVGPGGKAKYLLQWNHVIGPPGVLVRSDPDVQPGFKVKFSVLFDPVLPTKLSLLQMRNGVEIDDNQALRVKIKVDPAVSPGSRQSVVVFGGEREITVNNQPVFLDGDALRARLKVV